MSRQRPANEELPTVTILHGRKHLIYSGKSSPTSSAKLVQIPVHKRVDGREFTLLSLTFP